jgi:hypothetical protein
MTLNNSMSIPPSPPGQAKEAKFEHGSVLGEKPVLPGSVLSGNQQSTTNFLSRLLPKT